MPLKQHKTSDAIVSVACGEYHSVVMTRDGLVYTFGQNTCGNLGLGHYRDSKHPSLMNIKSSNAKQSLQSNVAHRLLCFCAMIRHKAAIKRSYKCTIYRVGKKSSNNEIAGAIKKNANEASENLQTNTTYDDRDNINMPKHGPDSNAGGVIDNAESTSVAIKKR